MVPFNYYFSFLGIRRFSSSANQIATAIKKLSVNVKKGKSTKWYSESTTMPTFVSATKLVNDQKGMGKKSKRRSNMLNKLYMRNITDIMATGDMAEKLLGYGIQVSKVNMTPDFNIVNVYWFTKGPHKDEEIDRLLKKTAGFIKHELSQLNVFGMIPHIAFVKDATLAKTMEVEKILGQIDFGDNYKLTDKAAELKQDLELQVELSPTIAEKIKKLEEICIESSEIDLPEMKNNVFGLDRTDIFNKVCKDMKKVQNAWETYSTNTRSIGVELNTQKMIEIQDRFQKYLSNREFEKQPRRKSWKRKPDDIQVEEDDPEHFHDGDYLDLDDESDRKF